jgi:hypothetical protein
MKLDCVLAACNKNPLYTEFIPIFVHAWKKLYPSIDVKIVLVSETLPDEFKDYIDNIILFPPIPGVNDAYIAQIIRLLYPSVLPYEGAVLITDMDMLPMNNKYYSDPIDSFSNDVFVHYRNGVMMWRDMQQYAMCYNAASPKTWKEINGITCVESIRRWIETNYVKTYSGVPDGTGWYSDQTVLHTLISLWSKKDTNFICLKDAEIGFRRLDRVDRLSDSILPDVAKGLYSDYHCLRPYKSFKEFNDKVVDSLPSQIVHINRTIGDWKYGTHTHPLLTAVLNTNGPVFEMGCGDYSTPMLHEICKSQKKQLLSSDTSREWIKLFLDLESSFHKFTHVPVYEDDWEKNPKPELWDNIGNDTNWGVVFIDHRPGERRKVDIARFADKTEIIVVHDTESSCYDYESVFHTFKYRYDYKRYDVYTTLVSNTFDVSKLFVC